MVNSLRRPWFTNYLVLMLLLTCQMSGQSTFAPAATYQGPLIDAHSHTPPEPEKLEPNIVPLLNQGNVSKIVLMGHEPKPSWPIGEDDKLTLQMYETHPKLVIPFLNCIRWGHSLRDPAWIQYVDQQLAAGKFRGVGQLIIKRYVSHDPKDSDLSKSTDLPWNSPFARNLVGLTARHNVPLMFMMESTPETLLALDRVLEENPNARFIWNHQNQLQDRIGPTPELRALSGDPQRVATRLEKYPNLYIDLTVGRDAVVRTESDRQIPEKWKDLYEKYKDRIIIGVDADTKKGFENRYLSEVNWIRSWISQLSSDAAKGLAYENIERILAPGPPTTVATQTLTTITRRPTGLLPLIDAHNHLPRNMTLDELIRRMDDAGVQKTLLMPVFYQGDKPQGQGISDENLVIEWYKKQPNRIIPFLGMQRGLLLDRNRWEHPDQVAEDFLRFTESQLKTGNFSGMGEFILWHYSYSLPGGAQGGTVKIPADTPLMKRFLDLAAKYRVPMTIHYEIEEDSLPPLKRMLEYGRNVPVIILAHNGGRPDPPTLKELLDGYPNAFCDLAGMNGGGFYGHTTGQMGGQDPKNPIADGTGHLRTEWKTLYEAYPDRFVGIGSDYAHPEAWPDPRRYRSLMDEWRSLLSGLSAQTREKIAFRNAEKLLGSPSTMTTTVARTTVPVTTPTSKTTVVLPGPGPLEMYGIYIVVVIVLAAVIPLFILKKRKTRSRISVALLESTGVET